MEDFTSCLLDTLDEGRRISPEEGNDRNTLLETNRKMFLDRKVKNEIYSEWFLS
jgi:hypothetical protein